MIIASRSHVTLGGYINVGYCALIHSRPRVQLWLDPPTHPGFPGLSPS